MKRLILFVILAIRASATPFVISEGDSLTAGTGASPAGSSNWVAQLALRRATTVFTNVAHSGDQIVGLPTTDVTNQLASAIAAGYLTRSVTLWIGINDIAVNTSVAATQSALESYVDAVRAYDAGCMVFVATLTAANIATNLDDRRQQLNAIIRTNTHWQVVVDLAADSRFDTLADITNTTYYDADGVHFNNNGYAVISTLFENVLSNYSRFSDPPVIRATTISVGTVRATR